MCNVLHIYTSLSISAQDRNFSLDYILRKTIQIERFYFLPSEENEDNPRNVEKFTFNNNNHQLFTKFMFIIIN